MWYIKKTKSFWLIMAIIFLGIMGCSEQESDIHLFYGEWSVREATWTLVNGKPGLSYVQNYFMELNLENCGTKYNLDKEETDRIKWLFNEGNEVYENHFLLSLQSNPTGGISNLGNDNLYFVMKLSEEEIILSRSKIRMSNDTIFDTVWNLKLTKE